MTHPLTLLRRSGMVFCHRRDWECSPSPLTPPAHLQVRRVALYKGLRVDLSMDARLENVSVLLDATRVEQILLKCASPLSLTGARTMQYSTEFSAQTPTPLLLGSP